MYLKLKEELKTLAKEIKKLKSERKSHSNGYVLGLLEKRHSARHKHVAYCMLRGKLYQEIEQKCHEAPDMDYIERIKEAHHEVVCVD